MFTVKLESSLKEAGDVGIWAEWTRACCDKRNLIEDFTYPINPALAISNPDLEKAMYENHLDSNLSIR